VRDLRTKAIALLTVVAGLTGCSAMHGPSSAPPHGAGIAGDVAIVPAPAAAGKVHCAVPKSVIKARLAQVVVVKAKGNKATVSGCSRRRGKYVRTLGPFAARIGTRGLAKRGAKREGDGRTPSGVFGLGSGFGSKGNPGLSTAGFEWFTAGRSDVWVDDPGSKLYNTHQKSAAHGRWRSAERLRIKPYEYAQVIRYNQKRIPGRGSAIFLHVGTGGPTAGCVSLSSDELRAVMKWESTGAVIAIS
jgi:L,D-peptidoglycan transpeptidase YkuD (ErfK/YbiS/YcfS/YnhG family)